LVYIRNFSSFHANIFESYPQANCSNRVLAATSGRWFVYVDRYWVKHVPPPKKKRAAVGGDVIFMKNNVKTP